MSKKFIIVLTFIFTFIFTNNSYAEDYLDSRWAKTGCKPLNERTKNALIPTDWEIGNESAGIQNNQRLYFFDNKVKDYKFYGLGVSRQNSGKITRIYPYSRGFFSHGEKIPNDKKPYFFYGASSGGYKGACYQKGFKGMKITVYLLKDKKDKKPYKWLEFESTGKGAN